MAYVKNWLHCVWGTKNRIPFLSGNLIKDLIDHIKTNGKSHLPNVRRYIKNQAEHHSKKSWEEEYQDLIEEYGFDRFPG
jgi:hypothetical protein